MIEIVKADVKSIIEVAELVSRITQRHISLSTSLKKENVGFSPELNGM